MLACIGMPGNALKLLEAQKKVSSYFGTKCYKNATGIGVETGEDEIGVGRVNSSSAAYDIDGYDTQ